MDYVRSEIYLLQTQLPKDYSHTVYFESKLQQEEWFLNLYYSGGKKYDDFTYIKKDNVIRIPLDYDKTIEYNYVVYKNTNADSKWYFAFITGYENKGEDQTNITIEIDVIQTYMFDYSLTECFVEREHVDNDTTGLHTFPENLECGEYVCVGKNSFSDLTSLNIVVGVTETPKTIPAEADGDVERWQNTFIGGRYYGTYSGISYVSFPLNDNGINDLRHFIDVYAHNGKNDAITIMFIVPNKISSALRNTTQSSSEQYTFSEIAVGKSSEYYKKEFELNVDKVGGTGSTYRPANNKLKCYPYRYLLVSNNNGASAIYQWEHFNDAKPLFDVIGTLTPSGAFRLIPKNYKGCAINDEEGLNLGKFPVCNWTSDEYTNWLTQNGVSIGINMVSGVGQILGGVAVAVGTGGVGGIVGGSTVISGVSTIANQLAQIHQMSFTPPQAHGNTNNGDIITAYNQNTFIFYNMSIKDEYLKIIDDYFTMYGYKIMELKIPNKNHRSKFWYTKTIGCNISRNSPESKWIPQDMQQKIKECYDKGITFWKSYGNFMNFSGENEII